MIWGKKKTQKPSVRQEVIDKAFKLMLNCFYGFFLKRGGDLMSNKTVFLADSSYAIRKIAERNFSDDNHYTLVTFKSGSGLREQILEEKPHVVLVELKLPEWNGYEVCRFINAEPSLENTHIFLLRAAFDPVEEDKLHGMTYVDIITKPFDHAALMESIEKLGKEEDISPEMGVPDDIPEIDDFDIPSEDLSFSDIKDVMDSEPSAEPPESISMTPPRSFESLGDEVQPSEEITQGSIPSSRDPLSPTPSADEIDNPFDDSALHEQIKEQESELGIGSITQEAMAIEASMASSKIDDMEEPLDEVPADGDTSEVSTSALDHMESEDEFKEFSFDDNEAMTFPSDIPEEPAEEPEEPADEEQEAYPVNSGEDRDSYERPTPPSFLDIAANSPLEEDFADEQDGMDKDDMPKDDLPNWAAPPEEHDFSDFDIAPPKEAPVDEDEEITGAADNDAEEIEEAPAPVSFEADEEMRAELPEEFDAPLDQEEADEEPSRFDDFPGVEDPSDEANYSFSVSPEPDNTRTSESDAISDFSEAQFHTPQEPLVEETLDEPGEEADQAEPAVAPLSQEAPVSLENLNATDREIIMQRIEQNISQTLKDILWDIIPPIAERIIREEIESIKKELAQSIE